MPEDPDIYDDLSAGAEPLTLAKAAREPCMRRDGRSVCPAQVYRHAKHGIRALVGGRTCTTRPALLRFIRRSTEAARVTARADRVRRETGRAHAAAQASLDAAGI